MLVDGARWAAYDGGTTKRKRGETMKTVAIVCEDGVYLERLVNALQRTFPKDIAVDGYLSAVDFSARDGNRRVNAVLLSESCGSAEEVAGLREQLAGRHVPVWMLSADKTSAGMPGQLFLYSPVDVIAGEISAAFSGEGKPAQNAPRSSGELRAFGVLALSDGNTSQYALALAKHKGLQTKTVLLCINPWPEGGKDWRPGENDFSELLYLLKEDGKDWYLRENLCLRDCGNVKVASGYTCFSDIGLLTEEDADALFAGLAAAGYETVVMDFAGIPVPVLAEHCCELHVMGATGERFRALSRMLCEEGLADRLRRVLPSEGLG